MPYQKILFKPGVNRDGTSYSDENSWYGSNKVRFKMGLPERIGGWARISDKFMDGTCRSLFSWRDFLANIRTMCGTHLKIYSSVNAIFTDVTPLRSDDEAIPGSDPFNATDNETYVTVSDPLHGAAAGDYVFFTGVVGGRGISATSINNVVVKIDEIVDQNSYKVDFGDEANDDGVFLSLIHI